MPSRKKGSEQLSILPCHVESFNTFVRDALFKKPKEAADFAKTRPEVCFGFGETPESRPYAIVTFEKSSALSHKIAWLNGLYTGERFLFSVEGDGSLARIIDFSYKTTDGSCENKVIATNLGVEMGVAFTEYLVKLLEELREEPWEERLEKQARILRSSGILDFCQTYDTEQEIIAILHDDLMKARIAAKEEPADKI